MTYDILLAGVGGQGVLSLAAIIAESAMAEGLFVKQSEVHGMSQRGGGVQAHLRLSDTAIASDLIPSGKADMILSMEPLESLRYLSWLKADGVVVSAAEPFINIGNYPEVESVYTMIKSLPKAHLVHTAELAKEAGNIKAENMVLIGTALAYLPLKKATVEQSVHNRFIVKDPKLVDINMKALALGAAAK